MSVFSHAIYIDFLGKCLLRTVVVQTVEHNTWDPSLIGKADVGPGVMNLT